jgi:hypothetical protein
MHYKIYSSKTSVSKSMKNITDQRLFYILSLSHFLRILIIYIYIYIYINYHFPIFLFKADYSILNKSKMLKTNINYILEYHLILY